MTDDSKRRSTLQKRHEAMLTTLATMFFTFLLPAAIFAWTEPQL